jgi:hypothetical protein
MPVIGFKKEFVPDIKSGKKPQTIRPAGKRKYKPGDRLYMYTGPYRPGERIKIGEAVVSEVVPLEILKSSSGEGSRFWLNGTHLTSWQALKLAEDDGFKYTNGTNALIKMINFFTNTYKLSPGNVKDFNIIKWRDFEPA